MGLRIVDRLKASMILVAIVMTLGTESVADPGQSPLLDTYLSRLGELRVHWRQATELVVRGETERALQILDQPLPEVLGKGWRESQKIRRDELRSMVLGDAARMGTRRFARWCMDMQVPGLAARAYEAARDAGEPLGFEDEFHLSQCYVEDGHFEKAQRLLDDLWSRNIDADWKYTIETRLGAIQGLQPGRLSRSGFLGMYFIGNGPRWYHDHVGPLLDAWKLPTASESDRSERSELVVRLFEQLSLPGDEGHGRRLVLRAVAEDPRSSPAEVAASLLRMAESAHKYGQTDEARRYWERIVVEFKGTPSWGSAVIGIGRLHQGQHRVDEAISWFRRVLDEPTTGGRDLGNNDRFYARRAIGDCFLEQGQYDLALAAYRATRTKDSFSSGCGTCDDGVMNRTALYEGTCLEHLGRHPESVEGYYGRALSHGGGWDPFLSARLVDLYEAAGQVPDLEAMLDVEDKRDGPNAGGARHLRSWKTRRFLEIRRLEITQDWDSLASLVRAENTTMGPETDHARTVDHEALEAAKRLARHPAEAVPRLKLRLEASPPADRRWLYYALGRCGTPEAVAVLKDWAKDAEGRSSLLYALKLAGDEGRAVFDTVSLEEDANLKAAIRSEPVGRSERELTYPPAPVGLKLPKLLKADR